MKILTTLKTLNYTEVTANHIQMQMKNYILLLFLLFTLIACSENKPIDDHNHPELSTGKELFNYHCASCHGEKGRGKFIDGIPPNALTKKTPKMVIQKIRFGDNSQNIMPIFKNMPKDEAKLIVDHLFELKKIMLSE